MDDYEDIATRIANVIVAPDSVLGFLHGVLSVPVDLGYLVYGYFDTDSHYAHETQRIRITQAIANGILDYDRIIDAIQIIFNQFNAHVSESQQNRIYSRTISSVTGRLVTSGIISKRIATVIAGHMSSFIKIQSGLTGGILLMGGMTERCIRTSEQLGVDEPDVYQVLRIKDYDLLYFLFEPALKPFIDVLSVRRMQGIPAFDSILGRVEDKIDGYYE